MPIFKVIRVGGRVQIAEIVEHPPPTHPILTPAAEAGDPLAVFILSQCLLTPTAAVAASHLHLTYTRWAGENGPSLTRTALGRGLTRLGFVRDKKAPGGRTRWLGLRLQVPASGSGVVEGSESRTSSDKRKAGL